MGQPAGHRFSVKIGIPRPRDPALQGGGRLYTSGDAPLEAQFMQLYPEIRSFVQEALGCTCPEEVFQQITVDDDSGQAARMIRIGGRLLVYILDAGRAPDLPGAVSDALRDGVRERERGRFNRLRLVVVSREPERISDTAEAAFSDSPSRDPKTHLHVLHADRVGFLQRLAGS